jgi:hypothetical protein
MPPHALNPLRDHALPSSCCYICLLLVSKRHPLTTLSLDGCLLLLVLLLLLRGCKRRLLPPSCP